MLKKDKNSKCKPSCVEIKFAKCTSKKTTRNYSCTLLIQPRLGQLRIGAKNDSKNLHVPFCQKSRMLKLRKRF